MRKEARTSVLMNDEYGKLRHLFSMQHIVAKKEPGKVIFMFGRAFKTAALYVDTEKITRRSIVIHETHVTYHYDGNILISCYGEGGAKIDEFKGHRNQGRPYSELGDGSKFLEITPFQISRFPLSSANHDHTLVLDETAVIPEFVKGGPLKIELWIGSGTGESILGKRAAIRYLHITQTSRNAEVYPLQHDERALQIFIVISRPLDLETFPEHTNIKVVLEGELNSGVLTKRNLGQL